MRATAYCSDGLVSFKRRASANQLQNNDLKLRYQLTVLSIMLLMVREAVAIANGSQTLSVIGDVYNYASANVQTVLADTGTLTGSGLSWSFKLGTVTQHNGWVTETLEIANIAPNSIWTDLLDGRLSAHLGSGFTTNASSFINLAGSENISLNISFNTTTVGNFNGDIEFYLLDHNNGGFTESLGTLDIALNGQVSANSAAVPEPEQWLMLLLGLPLISAASKRKQA